MTTLISPSILNCDFSDLQGELAKIANADYAHVDVMDNHFVPNLTMGPPIVEGILKVSPVPVDAHLMIEDADRWAPQYAELGCASVTFHAEATAAPLKLAREIRRLGARASLALRPATGIEPYLDILDEFDMILVMTVEPGFGGQSFMADQMPKLARLHDEARRRGSQVWLQVDGGISESTIAQAAEAGADTFVAGSAVFGADDPGQAIEALRREASAHQH